MSASAAQVTADSVVAGVPIRFPMVDVHTIGAGGGSIAWLDEGGALRVGPRSAGASPGPACYGRGGTEPTVTDANLALGYLADGAVLGGEVTSRPVARRARVSGTLDPAGVVEVVNANMARALRVVSVERGIDPRGLALVAFGGAGPLHACALAEELGIERVLVPLASGVLSALGLAVADLRRDYVGGTFEEMEARAAADLPGAVTPRFVDARYPGQSHELTIDARARTSTRRTSGGTASGSTPSRRSSRGGWWRRSRARAPPCSVWHRRRRPGTRRRGSIDGDWRRRPGARPGIGRRQAPRSSSCPARPASSAPAGRASPTPPARSSWSERWTR